MNPQTIKILCSSLFLAVLMPINAQAAVCAFGSAGIEPTLQDFVNEGVSPSFSTATCEDNDDHWQFTGQGTSTIALELAGFAHFNTFGIYDAENPDQQLQIFSGPNSAGTSRNITVTQSGSDYLFEIWQDSMLMASALFGSETFGFYIGTPQDGGQTFYSDTGLNPDGVDHMYAYGGGDSVFTDDDIVPDSLQNTLFGPNSYLLAWEDLLHGGDYDYQDFVIAMSNVTPVPLPTSLLLLGSGLILASIRRRKAS
jgi:hypothetical protein